MFLRHQLLADSEANSWLANFFVPTEFEDEPGTIGAITCSLWLAGLASRHNIHINRREFGSDILGESNISRRKSEADCNGPVAKVADDDGEGQNHLSL